MPVAPVEVVPALLLRDRPVVGGAAISKALATPRGVRLGCTPALARHTPGALLSVAVAKHTGVEADGVRSLAEAAVDQGIRP